MADVALIPPTRRACLDCGRQDVWDPERGEWTICVIDGERQVGEPFCLHEWDINGSHRPVSTQMPTAYITAPRAVAPDLARLLVEERLAACVNVLECESTYRWDGEIHEDAEAVLLAKTTEEAYGRVVKRVVEAHPYDVPCVERFDEADELEAFADWRDDAVE